MASMSNGLLRKDQSMPPFLAGHGTWPDDQTTLIP